MPIATRAARRRRAGSVLHQDAILYNILDFLDEKDDASVARVCKDYAALRRAFVLPCGSADDQVWNVVFNPSGTLVAADGDSRVKIYDARTGARLRDINYETEIRTVAFSPCGQWIAVGGADGCCSIYDAETGEMRRIDGKWCELEIPGDAWVSSAVYNSDGRLLAVGGKDGTVLVFIIEEYGLCIKERPNDVNALAFAPDDTLAVGDDSGLALYNRTADVRREHDIGALTDRAQVFTVSFSADGRIVAAGGLGRIIALFDTETGAQLRVIRYEPTPLGNSSIECSQFSPDGRWFAVGSYNGNVYLHDVADNFRERRVIERGGRRAGRNPFRDHGCGAVPTVAFSPDSSTVAIGAWDNTMSLYDVATGALCRRRESSRSS